MAALGNSVKIESNPNNKFTYDFSSYENIGFHGTSSLVESEIETHGFIPNKVFSQEEHEQILRAANKLEVDISWYQGWLEMRSITFAENEEDALSHIQNGSSGGQGLANLLGVLIAISEAGGTEERDMAAKFELIRDSSSVIYAVNLTGLGPRLVRDRHQPFYQVYFDPNTVVPEASIVSKESLIAKLQIINHA